LGIFKDSLVNTFYSRRVIMKIKEYVFVVGILMFFVSCVSQPIDWGIHNPNNLSEDDLITLFINPYVKVLRIDDDTVNWFGKENPEKQIVRIPSGIHFFHVEHYNSLLKGAPAVVVAALFERGNDYLLGGKEDEMEFKMMDGKTAKLKRFEFHIYLYNGGKEGKNVTINVNK
jgi:hypothetical protein